ncbi:MAG: hypothetical protein HFF06_03870 [Oscillospiraceae bacterium]|jgi:hypothetical protein|nr:hypothetical protein [Oscillospiraceae bacterium]
MDDRHSGGRTAAQAVRAAKAAANIARAAAVSGLPGAAAATAKETLPFLVKLSLGIIITIFVLLMMVISAIPNIFFGFGGTKTAEIATMNNQAKALGSTYINLEDARSTQVDAIVTAIVSEYESRGITINKIKVANRLSRDDIIWIIATNSVANEQNLSVMTPDKIISFCSSHLSYTSSLFSEDEVITLVIRFNPIDPDALMSDLGFTKQAKVWAGALQETLEKSDALSKYGPAYEDYHPSYDGDSPGGGGNIQHGSSFDNTIDITLFVNPHTKNNRDLVSYVTQAYENNWGYVWGTYGNILSEALLEYKIEQYPDGVGDHADFIEENWLGRRTADCVGLIKGYAWLDPSSLKIKYGTNEMPDTTANGMFQLAKNSDYDYGSIATMPEIPGLALWKDGHIGVYIGNGYAIEAMGTRYGVVKTEVSKRNWTHWCKLPHITYLEDT